MGRQIIKQPDGQFALWSTIVDNFILIDATPQEIIEFLLEEEKERIIDNITKVNHKNHKKTMILCCFLLVLCLPA